MFRDVCETSRGDDIHIGTLAIGTAYFIEWATVASVQSAYGGVRCDTWVASSDQDVTGALSSGGWGKKQGEQHDYAREQYLLGFEGRGRIYRLEAK